MDRRQFLKSAVVAPLLANLAHGESTPALPRGNAEHCIFIWLGGGMSHIDTFDPKDLGQNKNTPKKPGSLYASIDTSVPRVRVCEHLANTARVMEHVTIVRSINHHVIDEHAFATNL